MQRDLDQNLLSLLPLDMPATGTYDHNADKLTHLHRPDVNIPNLKMYRDKRLGERAGKEGPYYIQAPYECYDTNVAHR